MKNVLVNIKGKQYQVAEGDVLLVDKIDKAKGENIEFSQVYLLNEEGKISVGTPFLTKVKVKAVVEDLVKDKKISVATYKSKVRYRKKRGFRAKLTRIKILSIDTGAEKEMKPSEPKVIKKAPEKVKPKRTIKK